MILLRKISVGLFLLAGLAVMGMSASSYAQGEKDEKAKQPSPAVKRPANWNETYLRFEMQDKPYKELFRWFAEQTGMPYASKYPAPNGTFTFIPAEENKKYSLAEIFDIINEILIIEHKHVLIRREATISLWPADEEILPALIRQITWDQLKQCAQTEIVAMMMKIEGQNVEDLAPSVKRALGNFGKVTPYPETNQLFIQGDVAAIRRAEQIMKMPEDSTTTFTYQCKYIRASTMASVISTSLGRATQLVVTKGSASGPGGGGTDAGGGPGGGGPGGGGPGGGGPFGGGGGGPRQPPGGGTSTKLREHTVTSEKTTNTVIIHGPADKIAQAKTIIAKIDVKQSEKQIGIIYGAPVVNFHDLPSGSSDTMTKVLGEIFKEDSTVKIQPINPTRLFVYADPQTQLEVSTLIANEIKPVIQEAVVVQLTQLDATKFADTLKLIFPDSKNGAPYIEADSERNGIRIRGTPDQIKEVKAVIGVYDDNPTGGGGVSSKGRTIILEKGSGATLAEGISILMGKMYPDLKIEVTLPGQLDDALKKPDSFKKGLKNDKNGDKKEEGKPSTQITPDRLREAIYLSKESYASLNLQEPKQAEKKGPTLKITGFGNRIIIDSDDPKALNDAQQLIRLLVNTEAGPGDFEVLRLTYANSVEVAKILDEAYNGPKNQGGGGRGGPPGGGGGSPFGGGLPGMVLGGLMGGGGQSTRTENIRVVADPATNSLLIRAKPIDMLTIRRLLNQQLDVRNTDSEAIARTHPLPLKYANAADVAGILQQVYAEAMSSKVQVQGQVAISPFMAGFGGGSRMTDTGGIEKRVLMSVGVDAHTNTLYVSCPTTLFNDVKTLVDSIEMSSSKSESQIQIVQVRDIDPLVLQQAVAAITGQSTAQQRRPGTFDPGLNAGSFAPGAFGSQMRGFGNNFQGSGFQGFQGAPTPIFMGVPGGGGGGPTFGPGGGGTFTPGGGGGIRQPGGGGGGPGGGGIRKGGGGQQSRGPDFFEQRVMDDPSVSAFYDPFEEQDEPRVRTAEPGLRGADVFSINPLRLVALQDQPAPPKPKDGKEPPKDGAVTPPRLPVQIESIPDAGILILKANNPNDLKAVLEIIRLLREEAKDAAIVVELVPVRLGDPTNIVKILSDLYSRVNLGQGVTSLVVGTPTGGPQVIPTAPGVPTAPGAATAAPRNMVLIPIPRLGGILVAASKQRLKEIKDQIQRLDVLPDSINSPVAIKLDRVSASRVATALNNFYLTRFPGDTQATNQIRITWDDNTNTIFAQASPGDLIDIRNMINHMDKEDPGPTGEIRVVVLKNAVAVDLYTLLNQAIANGVLAPVQTMPTTPGGGGVIPGGGGIPGGGIPGGGIPGGGIPGGGAQSMQGQSQIPSRFQFPSNIKGIGPLSAGILQDIKVNYDQRTNSLIISAPAKTMPLLLAIIRDLDLPPASKSEITIFTLKKTDATQMALSLQQLFTGSGNITQRTTTTGPVAPTPTGPTGPGGTTTKPPLQFSIFGETVTGAPIIDLRLTVDDRTNSIIAAGSRNDLNVIESIIARLEDTDILERRYEAVKLRNSNAADVANAISTFLANTFTILNTNYPSTHLNMQRQVLVVAEPISNSILISATPKMFAEIVALIAKLDTTPMQVVVQVLIAEVTMSGAEEFGMEIGLQMPLLFDRGVNVAGTGADAIYRTFTPGYNFTNPLLTQPDNVNVNPSKVGIQGLSTTGVGRSSANGSGFVFSAASNTVSVLIRALKVQGRITVLSRPQLMTLDNQTALIQVGQDVPYVTGSPTITAAGVISNTPIAQRQTGVNLLVTPRITPDGRVLMRVIPDITSLPVNSTVDLGNGVKGTIFNTQHLETTVAAVDGETIMLGGMITRRDEKNETKVPWLGDLPGIGAAFRYRTYKKDKTELIIILTPHIVRNRFEAERILTEESRRVDWVMGDVLHVHGMSNLMPLMPPIRPEAHNNVQTFRIIPGSAKPQDRPAPITPVADPAPTPQVAPPPANNRVPLLKGGLLQNVLSRRTAETAVEPPKSGLAPLPDRPVTTKVQYAPGPGGSPMPQSELIPANGAAPMPSARPPADSPVVIMPDRR